jgi:hypothetical protein
VCKGVYIKQCHKMEEIVNSICVILYSLLLYLLYNVLASRFQNVCTLLRLRGGTYHKTHCLGI